METHPHLVTHLPITNYFDRDRKPSEDLHFALAFVHPRVEINKQGYLIREHGIERRRHRVIVPQKDFLWWFKNVGLNTGELLIDNTSTTTPQLVKLRSGEQIKIPASRFTDSKLDIYDRNRGNLLVAQINFDYAGIVGYQVDTSEDGFLATVQRRTFVPQIYFAKEDNIEITPIRKGRRRIIGYEGMTHIAESRDHRGNPAEKHNDRFAILCGDEQPTHLKIKNNRWGKRELTIEWFTHEEDPKCFAETPFEIPGGTEADMEIIQAMGRVDIVDTKMQARVAITYNSERMESYEIRNNP